jgi:hypothetical protein
MSDSERRELMARVNQKADPAAQPAVDKSNLPVTRRSDFRGKVSQLWDITQASGPNGNQGIAAAVAARTNPQPAPPQPEPAAPQGFSSNRAQGASSSDWAPINERDRNRQKINDIMQGR